MNDSKTGMSFGPSHHNVKFFKVPCLPSAAVPYEGRTVMSLYKRGEVWWFKFRFANQTVRESSKSSSRTVAKAAEQGRRRELELGYNGIQKTHRAQLFSVAAESFLKSKTAQLAPRSLQIERSNLTHLNPVFGRLLLSDITPDHLSTYQFDRLREGASPKTINLEVGTLRGVLRKFRLWANLQPDVRFLKVKNDVGICLSEDQQQRLLQECARSRSRSLHVAVVLALTTCMRHQEIRTLRWTQIDFSKRLLTVGQSKTDAGTGRHLPLNQTCAALLTQWAKQFPSRKPTEYVFPTERYGAAGNNFSRCVYHVDPTKPIGDWKEAWEAAKKRAGVECRFHDLRHTGCTRMLEAGVPFAVVAEVMGWSASTAIRMAKRYGHIGQSARIQAMQALELGSRAQNWAHSETEAPATIN